MTEQRKKKFIQIGFLINFGVKTENCLSKFPSGHIHSIPFFLYRVFVFVVYNLTRIIFFGNNYSFNAHIKMTR